MPEQCQDVEALLPLTETIYQTLLALVNNDRLHGYGIMLEVEKETDGRIKMNTGTLYGALKRLLAAGLIDEVDPPGEAIVDRRQRRYYQLTSLGNRVVTAEAERLNDAAQQAFSKGILQTTSSTALSLENS